MTRYVAPGRNEAPLLYMWKQYITETHIYEKRPIKETQLPCVAPEWNKAQLLYMWWRSIQMNNTYEKRPIQETQWPYASHLSETKEKRNVKNEICKWDEIRKWDTKMKYENEIWKWNMKMKYENEIWKWNMKTQNEIGGWDERLWDHTRRTWAKRSSAASRGTRYKHMSFQKRPMHVKETNDFKKNDWLHVLHLRETKLGRFARHEAHAHLFSKETYTCERDL